MIDDSHTYTSPGGLEAGVWPKTNPKVGPNHFQVIGCNGRGLSVLDMGGTITVGGIEVDDPDHLDEFAARITHLASLYRERTGA